MVFCNLEDFNLKHDKIKSHNPYFNRWFSAIGLIKIYKS